MRAVIMPADRIPASCRQRQLCVLLHSATLPGRPYRFISGCTESRVESLKRAQMHRCWLGVRRWLVAHTHSPDQRAPPPPFLPHHPQEVGDCAGCSAAVQPQHHAAQGGCVLQGDHGAVAEGALLSELHSVNM